MRHFVAVIFFLLPHLSPAGDTDIASQVEKMLSETLFVESRLYTAEREELDKLNQTVAEAIQAAINHKKDHPAPKQQRHLQKSLGAFPYLLYQQKYSRQDRIQENHRKKEEKKHATHTALAFHDRGLFWQQLSIMHQGETKKQLLEKAIEDYSYAIEILSSSEVSGPHITYLLYMRAIALAKISQEGQALEDLKRIYGTNSYPVKGLFSNTSTNRCSKKF